MLYQNNDGMNFAGMSDDENYFALSKTINTNDSDLFIYNASTKETAKVNDKLSSNSAQDFSKDNNTFYYTTDDGSEFSYLMSYNLGNGEKKKIVEKDWEYYGKRFNRKWLIHDCLCQRRWKKCH